MRSKALSSYESVQVVTGVNTADPVQLIQMLFDGLVESLVAARGHMEHNAIEEKSRCLARAGRIVLGLQGALDFERGGEIAISLNELYSYVTRRLLHINANNDLAALQEVHGLLHEIRQAWGSLPSLLASTTPRASGMSMAAMA